MTHLKESNKHPTVDTLTPFNVRRSSVLGDKSWQSRIPVNSLQNLQQVPVTTLLRQMWKCTKEIIRIVTESEATRMQTFHLDTPPQKKTRNQRRQAAQASSGMLQADTDDYHNYYSGNDNEMPTVPPLPDQGQALP